MFKKMRGQPPPPAHIEEIGYTQEFVLARGFQTVGRFDALIGWDNSRRLFAELSADRDRPDVRPLEAYASMLTSMHSGWKFRLLQLYWPDPEPRQAFYQHVLRWGKAGSGLQILKDGLLLALDQIGLPFGRRTFVELDCQGDECVTWWESLPAVCAPSGVNMSYLQREEITKLTRWIFNPSLE
jgi:hypothetical protein